MRIKQAQLQGIKEGTISFAFRKWKKPLATKNSLVKTSLGQVKIVDISQVPQEFITKKDAIAGGYSDLPEQTKLLDSRAEGNVYKMQVEFHGAYPRIELHNQTMLTDEELEQLRVKLDRLDKISREGGMDSERLASH